MCPTCRVSEFEELHEDLLDARLLYLLKNCGNFGIEVSFDDSHYDDDS
jgi:hypothetical protein